jgi:uncharacterized protein involved in exopolysaccharide biosynthesis
MRLLRQWRQRSVPDSGALLHWRESWTAARLGLPGNQPFAVTTHLRLAAIGAVAGALIAGGVSFALPVRYSSSVVLGVVGPEGASNNDAQRDLFSRANLTGIIQRPSLDLYAARRAHYPLEDVIEEMRTRDLRTETLDSDPRDFRVTFEYPDRAKARETVVAIIGMVVVSGGLNLEVVDLADLDARPIQPDRLGIAAIGLGAGCVLGLLFTIIRRRQLRWTLWMITASVIGFVINFFAGVAADVDPASFGALGAAAGMYMTAYLLRNRAAWRPVPYLRSAAAIGAVAAIAAGLFSFATPPRYVSTSTLRVIPQDATLSGAQERLSGLETEILSRGSLSELIQRPALDLYRSERARQPLDEVIEQMRRDIRVQRIYTTPATFIVSFEHADPLKSRAVVRELVARFTERNVGIEQNLGHRDSTAADVIHVAVVKPPSEAEAASSPDRLRIIGIGFAAGLPLGLAIAFLRRRPPGQGWAALRRIAAAGAAGGAIAAAIAFAIPDRYASTAVLRVPTSARSNNRVPELMMEVLSSQNLSAEVRRHVRIRSLEVGKDGHTSSFSISCESTDPRKAHDTVQTLVSQFVEPRADLNPPGAEQVHLEVLDAASLPNHASFPGRVPISAVGLIAGIAAGMAQAARRKPYSAAA